jgi:hypothetical protein
MRMAVYLLSVQDPFSNTHWLWSHQRRPTSSELPKLLMPKGHELDALLFPLIFQEGESLSFP